MNGVSRYRLSNYSIILTVVLSIAISIVFKWNYSEPVNFVGGDAKDYYAPLVSVFINHDLTHQSGGDWNLLHKNEGTVNVHPVGVALLLLPFFLLAYFFSGLFGFPADGYSFPFQLSVAVAAMVYAVLGLVWLKKLLQLNGIGDRISAWVLLLIFFGTNLLNYTVSEAGMSHVYSFALISAFLYFSCRYVKMELPADLMRTGAFLGLVLLVRPNNIIILLSVFIWFKSWEQCKQFFRIIFKNKYFYSAVFVTGGIVLLQSLVWYLQSGSIFQNTYVRDGFYWLHPQMSAMLFGFDGGFFIYTPLCLLFLFGLIFMYRESRFSFLAVTALCLVLFYFFASYWAYTYFDGLGIRVLVDYYALFAFIGAKLFVHLQDNKILFGTATVMAVFFVFVNLVYCYQANRSILLRAGMTFQKWKYVFLRTGTPYQNCLGGSSELVPYAEKKPPVILDSALRLDQAFDFSDRDYGPAIAFEKMGFDSNRIRVKLACRRKELFANSSEKVQVCLTVEDPNTKEKKSYVQFKLNETPSKSCCEPVDYSYTANVVGDFKAGDRLSIYLWNIERQPFLLDKFAVEVYNYNYQLN